MDESPKLNSVIINNSTSPLEDASLPNVNNAVEFGPRMSGDIHPQNLQSPSGMIMDPPLNPVKRFVFRSKKRSDDDSSILRTASRTMSDLDVLEVIVPERMQASYGLYVWPSAPILAWYLYEHRQYLPGKRVLELGAGTALPGVVAALLGAQVTLSDSAKLPQVWTSANEPL
ncbi:Methyltransferase-like protein 23, partial [Orchesella cincta]